MLWHVVAVLAVGSELTCQTGKAIAPPTSESVPVLTTTRPAIPLETLPAAQVSGGAGSVDFIVKREGYCAVVDAQLSREPNGLAVVGHVWGSASANCATPTQRSVIEYHGVIRVAAPGDYHVRIFDATGDDTPHLIETTVVTVK